MLTAVNLMLFSLLHNPCATTIMTIYKETLSKKWAADRRADAAGARVHRDLPDRVDRPAPDVTGSAVESNLRSIGNTARSIDMCPLRSALYAKNYATVAEIVADGA